MSKQKLKGLWIPVEILLNEELSDKEKLILSMILYLSDETGSCFASNKYIASIVNVTSDRVSKIVSSLKKKEYIKVTFIFKNDFITFNCEITYHIFICSILKIEYRYFNFQLIYRLC